MKHHSHILKALCLGAAIVAGTTEALSWGQKGHDVTCAIAQKHLSPKARKQVTALLDGKSPVYWANWMDNASHTKQYSFTSTWHYKNIDAEETYENAQVNRKGDVVLIIPSQIEVLKSKTSSLDDKKLAMRMLVHLVGDIHCPMHMGHKSDRGGNKWQLQYFGKGTNLHSIWDSSIIESAHKWSYDEWVKEIDTVSPKEVRAITAGSVNDWGKETYAITCQIYESTPVGSKLSYDYVSQWTPTIEQQLLRGGLRLAAILNEIYK